MWQTGQAKEIIIHIVVIRISGYPEEITGGMTDGRSKQSGEQHNKNS